MKLTRRQEDFIRKLLDLYHQEREPIHYSEVAKRIGVSPFTAYDMLRRLEQMGLTSLQYRLASDKSGPGRSEVVFVPTPAADQLIRELAGEVDFQDWEQVKERILQRVRSGDLDHLTQERDVLVNIPQEGDEALRYCAEVMAVIALRLSESGRLRLAAAHLPKLLGDETVNSANLGLLGGFALGILVSEIGDREWTQQLIEHVKHYQALVAEMDTPACQRLARSLKESFAPLFESS